jgi:hypothetical protein
MSEKRETTIDQNMRFYVKVQDTPKEAQKSFNNGRFIGTDINPMWRIKMLTQIFGPAGIGWWTENEKYVFEPSEATGEIAVFCTLQLRYVDPETKEISHPVSGIGGNKFIVSQKTGKYCNDEAYKMAYTDALSIACKSLGFSHDIYYQNDRTKYTMSADNQPEGENKPTHTSESVELIDKIEKKLAEIGKGMGRAEKITFANTVIVPIIGTPDYKTCMDVGKLSKLLKKLNESEKKAA